VRWTRDLVCVMEIGRCGYMGFLLLYVRIISEFIIVRSVVPYYGRNPMYPHLPTSMTHTGTRVHLTSYLPTVYSP